MVGFATFLARRAVRPSALALLLVAPPGFAAEPLFLKGDITAATEVIALGDLVEGVAPDVAETVLFRAPAPGATGTIQTRRIIAAARELGIAGIDTRGRPFVVVTRAARRIGPVEIEEALKAALAARYGLEPRALALTLDGAPALVVASDAHQPVEADEVVLDRRSRRVAALIRLAGWPQAGAGLRVAGSVVEMAEVVVLRRSLGRSDAVQAGDLALERRPKDTIGADAETDPSALAGRVARRPLAAGTVLRAGDLGRPDLVLRGEPVMIVYEVPGLVLTLRGRANENGAFGDTVAVANPQSKRVLQAVVAGPGRVSITPALPGRIAAVAP